MKYLYKYPQAAFPYGDLVETNRRRNRNDMEYELLDTGVFQDDRYFGWRIRGTGGAADVLGLKPTTLEARMAKLGIHRPVAHQVRT